MGRDIWEGRSDPLNRTNLMRSSIRSESGPGSSTRPRDPRPATSSIVNEASPSARMGQCRSWKVESRLTFPPTFPQRLDLACSSHTSGQNPGLQNHKSGVRVLPAPLPYRAESRLRLAIPAGRLNVTKRHKLSVSPRWCAHGVPTEPLLWDLLKGRSVAQVVVASPGVFEKVWVGRDALDEPVDEV
jgi:hypothetical protein